MPTLRSGKRADGSYRTIKLTDSQMDKLGFTDEEPVVLGCGTQACAYLPHPNSDVVIKITKDERDALVAYMVMNLPSVPHWAIPVHAVYRLPHHTFVIVTSLADPLPEDLAAAIEEIYQDTMEDESLLDNWPETYESEKAYFKREKAKGEDVKADERAWDAVNEAITAFKHFGLDWADFHNGNWMLYDGRPVVVDFGMSQNLDEPPVEELNERVSAILAGHIKQIPVLRF